ncbi:MAG: YfcC family protein, partial [bacterium]|nr:YfcC family protein [bacterium]
MKRLWTPDSLVLIFVMILAAQGLSYVLPAGEYERTTVDGRDQVVAGTYHAVETRPLPAWAFLTAIPRGLGAAADIIFFVFIAGGAFGVIRATGAIDALIAAAIRRFGGSPGLLIGGMLTLFALGSATIGMGEEYIPFVPVLAAMCIALGMDAVVAVALVAVGLGVGFGCAAVNPFTVVIAQRIAGLPLYSGQLFRWILFVLCLAIAIHHLLRYSRRVRKDSSKSLVAGLDLNIGRVEPDALLTPRHVAVLAMLGLAIALFVFGVASWGWFMVELGAVFLAIAGLAAIAGAIPPNRAAKEFTKGAAELTNAALLIGFARTIQVVLDDASIKDTVIHGIAGTLEGLPPAAAAAGMLGVQSLLNLFIPSGSG